MPVTIIPYYADPRQLQLAVHYQRFPDIFDLDEFPYLPLAYIPPSTPTKLTRFPELPQEIQEMIIEYSMRLGGHFEKQVDLDDARTNFNWPLPQTEVSVTRPKFLPAICWTSKTMRAIAAPVYIRNSTFIVRCIGANRFLASFLESIPGGLGLLAMKEVWFPSFHWFPGVAKVGPSSDLALMSRCTGLNRVKFTFHVEKLNKPAPTDSGKKYENKTVEELLDFYQLGIIFKSCEHLQEVTFDGIEHRNWTEYNTIGDPYKPLVDLSEWMKSEFKKAWKKELAISIEWRWRRFGGAPPRRPRFYYYDDDDDYYDSGDDDY